MSQQQESKKQSNIGIVAVVPRELAIRRSWAQGSANQGLLLAVPGSVGRVD